MQFSVALLATVKRLPYPFKQDNNHLPKLAPIYVLR